MTSTKQTFFTVIEVSFKALFKIQAIEGWLLFSWYLSASKHMDSCFNRCERMKWLVLKELIISQGGEIFLVKAQTQWNWACREWLLCTLAFQKFACWRRTSASSQSIISDSSTLVGRQIWRLSSVKFGLMTRCVSFKILRDFLVFILCEFWYLLIAYLQHFSSNCFP